MRCSKCQGKGFVKVEVRAEFTATLADVWQPCPDCNGCGLTYCCEGEDRWSDLTELSKKT
jgi:DnaJ-class molecular chaperone